MYVYHTRAHRQNITQLQYVMALLYLIVNVAIFLLPIFLEFHMKPVCLLGSCWVKGCDVTVRDNATINNAMPRNLDMSGREKECKM